MFRFINVFKVAVLYIWIKIIPYANIFSINHNDLFSKCLIMLWIFIEIIDYIKIQDGYRYVIFIFGYHTSLYYYILTNYVFIFFSVFLLVVRGFQYVKLQQFYRHSPTSTFTPLCNVIQNLIDKSSWLIIIFDKYFVKVCSTFSHSVIVSRTILFMKMVYLF